MDLVLDHLVLTVRDLDETIRFYTRGLGMQYVRFGGGRHALRFGDFKNNLHPCSDEILPRALAPSPGSADLCFRTETPVAEVKKRLQAEGIEVELGPVTRTGARRALQSLYLRDPDGNLIELSNET